MTRKFVRRYARYRTDEDIDNGFRGTPFGVAEAYIDDAGYIHVGFSRCSGGDTFNRELAITIARNRMNHPKYTFPIGDIENGSYRNHISRSYSIQTIAAEIDWVVHEAIRRSRLASE